MIQTKFKRIETKYVVSKENFEALLADLKQYLKEDEYPTSTISNVYFDTEDFDVIKDALAGKHLREKVRMRSYIVHPTPDSQAFLEIKQKDTNGVGHKQRMVATPYSITALLTGQVDLQHVLDKDLADTLTKLKDRYGHLQPRVFIYYDRLSLKQKNGLSDKIRVTFDQNLAYRSESVHLYHNRNVEPLLDDDQLIMEIKAPADKPEWLEQILEKHGLVQMKFSKYSAAYHKANHLPYEPHPALLTERSVANV